MSEQNIEQCCEKKSKCCKTLHIWLIGIISFVLGFSLAISLMLLFKINATFVQPPMNVHRR